MTILRQMFENIAYLESKGVMSKENGWVGTTTNFQKTIEEFYKIGIIEEIDSEEEDNQHIDSEKSKAGMSEQSKVYGIRYGGFSKAITDHQRIYLKHGRYYTGINKTPQLTAVSRDAQKVSKDMEQNAEKLIIQMKNRQKKLMKKLSKVAQRNSEIAPTLNKIERMDLHQAARETDIDQKNYQNQLPHTQQVAKLNEFDD